MTATLVFIVVLGLIVGSFLNVCIHRIPREVSIVFPASHCPACTAEIKPYDNIPVLSYIFLMGRCRACKARIPLRYPIVESLNALLWALVFLRYGTGWHLPVYLAFVSSLIVITFIDLDFQIIPDRISLVWIPLGIIAGALVLPDAFERERVLGWATSLIGAASGFTLFFVIMVASKGGMGGGDVKMMAMVGAVLGWKGVLLTTFVGSVSGSLLGLALVIFHGGGRKTKVPFGPHLAFGALVALLSGQEIFRAYMNLMNG